MFNSKFRGFHTRKQKTDDWVIIMDGITDTSLALLIEEVFCRNRLVHTSALISLAVQRDRGMVVSDKQRAVLTVPSMTLDVMLSLEKPIEKWIADNVPQLRWFAYANSAMPLDCLEMVDGDMVLREGIPFGILQ